MSLYLSWRRTYAERQSHLYREYIFIFYPLLSDKRRLYLFTAANMAVFNLSFSLVFAFFCCLIDPF
jgi:hypothetical protein